MRLFLIFALVVFIVGCGKKSEPELADSAQIEQEAPVVDELIPEPVVEESQATGPVTEHEVVKGECLWFIAGYDHIYGNPFKWPDIYEANKDQIKNPDLIYPEQVFQIPR